MKPPPCLPKEETTQPSLLHVYLKKKPHKVPSSINQLIFLNDLFTHIKTEKKEQEKHLSFINQFLVLKFTSAMNCCSTEIDDYMKNGDESKKRKFAEP